MSREADLRDFAAGASAANIDRAGRWSGLLLMALMLAAVLAGLAWASWAVIEEVTRAPGEVIPSGDTQVVQSLEGGLVAEIFVEVGDAVTKGQPLIRIDDTAAASNVGELTARKAAQAVRLARLEAEENDAERPDFSFTDLAEDDPRVLQELALFDSRRAAHEGQRTLLDAQIWQRERELDELDATVERTRERLGLIEEEIELRTASGVVPRAQLLPLERDRISMRQDLDVLKAQIARAEAALAEARARREDLELSRRADISTARADVVNELAVIEEALRRARDVVTRADLRAPVDGTVSELNVNTVGAVIGPGEEILRIVPGRQGLEVRAKVSPKDIAFVTPGMQARVKLTAYDFTIHGALDGRVVRVSPDTREDPRTGEVHYPVIIETEADQIGRDGEVLEVLPGMVAEVDIVSGQHTVLDYLAKPFVKARYEALRER